MKNLFLLIISLCIFSCSDDAPVANATATFPITITPAVIAKGGLTYNTIFTTQNIVVSNEADWTLIKNKFTTVNSNILNNAFTETTVNFSTHRLLFLYVKQSAGSGAIKASTIVENANNIVVTVQITEPNTTQMFNEPFEIIKIPASTKPVVFQ